ncbi:MAG: prolipoprotein diacylglyceryl transferase [Eubacteriales bacterium]
MDESRVAFYIFNKPIYWYAIIIVAGIIAATIIAVREARKKGYNADMILDFIILALPLAIIGARIYYVAFEWELYSSDLLSILYIWNGGLALYGGLIGGIIAAIIFCKWKKVPFGDLIDIVAPSIVLAQAVGRWGNFANQEAFGAAVTNPSLQFFPLAVYIDSLSGWYMATFFYESIWNLGVFFALLQYRKKPRERGNVFALYLMLYGIGRAIIEGFRTDSLYLIRWGNAESVYNSVIFDGIRISQLLSLLMVAGAIAYFIWRRHHALKELAYSGEAYSIEYELKQREKLNALKDEKKIKNNIKHKKTDDVDSNQGDSGNTVSKPES